MSCSGAEHTIEYLKPSQLFREVMKRDYYHYPAFIGLSFTEEYVRVAMSDKLFAWIHGEFPRDNTLLDTLVDAVQSVRVDQYDLIGFIIEDDNSVVENIHNLMDKLYKKGNFETLKYTCWKDDIESENSSFCLAPFGFLFWRKAICSERREGLLLFSAEHMLQNFLDFFWALYMDEYEEWEDKDEEREDKDLEMEDSKRKMIEYLKPLQFFQETIVSNYDNPVLPVIIGLSFDDVAAAVGFSSYYMNARPYCVIRRDETLLDNLVEVVQRIEKYIVGKYELLGIIVDDNNSVKDILNLLDDLCKKGNFKSLKYTCWKVDIGSKNSIYDRIPSRFLAEYMLQSFLDFFRALYIDKDLEIEVKDDESLDIERKVHTDDMAGSSPKSPCHEIEDTQV